MVEAEEERRRMSDSIDDLEEKRKELEMSNARVIAENRDLLNQLELLNSQVVESDVEIQALTSTLAATRFELQRLTTLANRAEQLEKQLIEIENDHAELMSTQSNTEDENRTSIQRWKRAEGTIIYLQDQIDRIEREALEERQRHVEVIGRFERRRVVEQELEKAAGRMKGVAESKSLKQEPGTNVVSHFVRDILQDNANLQNGVVELREMLLESNSEVENLREQLQLHRPIENEISTLKEELVVAKIPAIDLVEESQFEQLPEVHVHHHYHAPEITIKRSKKKRNPLATTYSTPSGASTPRHHHSREWRISTSSANTILSQTSVTIPENRWSIQSSQTGHSYTPSSIPSSPRRESSVFDSLESVFDSRPSTPDHNVLGSPPPTQPRLDKRLTQDLTGYRNSSIPSPLQPLRKSATTRISSINTFTGFDPTLRKSPHSIILEEPDIVSSDHLTDSSATPFSRPLHRRAASHESLFSLSESHRPLKSQFSQTFGMTDRGFSPIAFTPTTAQLIIEPMIVHATVSALPRGSSSDRGTQQDARVKSILSQAGTSGTTKRSSGGWAWGKWNKTSGPPALSTKSPQTPQSPFETMLRAPGVNQSGWVRGLKPPRPTPSKVQPEQIDQAALIEALRE